MSIKTTTKQRFTLAYNLHHWGTIDVEADTYYEACEEAWRQLYGCSSWSHSDAPGLHRDGSEYEIENTPIEPPDWPNPHATSADEVWEEPSEDDEIEEYDKQYDFIPASDKGLEVEG